MTDYATIEDIQSLYRTLTTSEQTIATAWLPIVTDKLRQEASNRGKNLDEMVANGEASAQVVKAVVVEAVRRILNNSDTDGLSQMSQSAGGYTLSGTFFSPGNRLYFTKEELKAVGLKKQTLKGFELC